MAFFDTLCSVNGGRVSKSFSRGQLVIGRDCVEPAETRPVVWGLVSGEGKGETFSSYM